MAYAQDTVFAAIKSGCDCPDKIMQKTGVGKNSIYQSIKRLRKWGLVAVDEKGHYKNCKEPRFVSRMVFGTEENNY